MYNLISLYYTLTKLIHYAYSLRSSRYSIAKAILLTQSSLRSQVHLKILNEIASEVNKFILYIN